MTHQDHRTIGDETFAEYRARIEIAIRERFAARGQTIEDAERFIAEIPNEPTMKRIRRALERRITSARD